MFYYIGKISQILKYILILPRFVKNEMYFF